MRNLKNIIVLTILVIISFILFTTCKNKKHESLCFTVDKSTAHIGDTLTFTNCSVDEEGAPLLDVEWLFGDNTYGHNDTGKTITHVYKNKGIYKVIIGVFDADYENVLEKKVTIE